MSTELTEQSEGNFMCELTPRVALRSKAVGVDEEFNHLL